MAIQKCEGCGTETAIAPAGVGKHAGLCLSCRKKDNEAILADWLQNDLITGTCGEDEVVCPWCGFRHGEFEDVETDEEPSNDVWCGECGNLFHWEPNYTVTYSTQRKEAK